MKLPLNPQCLPDPDKLAAEMAQIQAESIGWLPLEPGAYLHVGDPQAMVIEVVGLPQAGMEGMNVLLVR